MNTRPRPRRAAITKTSNALTVAPAKAPAGSAHTARAASPLWIARTAPSDAPVDTPRMPGSASGLRKRPWSAAPATASPPPTTNPSSARGKRTLQITVSRQECGSGCPESRCPSAVTASASEMCAGPKVVARTSTSAATGSAATSTARAAPGVGGRSGNWVARGRQTSSALGRAESQSLRAA